MLTRCTAPFTQPGRLLKPRSRSRGPFRPSQSNSFVPKWALGTVWATSRLQAEVSAGLCAGQVKGRTGVMLGRGVARLELRSGATSWDFVCRTVLPLFFLTVFFCSAACCDQESAWTMMCVHVPSDHLPLLRELKEVPFLDADTSCKCSAGEPAVALLTPTVDVSSICCQLHTVFVHSLCLSCLFLGALS